MISGAFYLYRTFKFGYHILVIRMLSCYRHSGG